MYFILAVVSGCTTVLSRLVNASLGERVGVNRSTRINYVVGLTVALLLVVWLGGEIPRFVKPTSVGSFLMYFGGPLGVAVVTLSTLVAKKLSSFIMTILVFVSQMLTGLILDYFLKGTFSLVQILGACIMVVGLIVYQSGGKKVQKPH